ncbi:PadR family transcriptional regulator [Deinococcus multiflagellatus]|uniref:PadR family transcriptional regulator n=1 Tax=Deinococcus multiflagellatus TaxID=1656887 RepID=A0ABW1ZPZ5_9DEIO|nr:PadR family transcriptional regulator [Deinococcus multiflagellatus]MBZ9715627.1 PadR family transcriptional regulator [Deinococcus multiflagellatus]
MPRGIQINKNALKVMKVLYDDLDGEHYGVSLGQASGLGNGTLYPILDKLEDLGFLTGDWEKEPAGRRPRFLYRLTAEGIQAFQAERAALFGTPEVHHV